MKITINAVRLAGGISKWGPILLSSVVPCLMKSVNVCITMVLGIIVKIKIGIIFIICLVSSTCVTVQSIHDEVWPVFTAALSRNLREHKWGEEVCKLN
jgi:hypothetical protein